ITIDDDTTNVDIGHLKFSLPSSTYSRLYSESGNSEDKMKRLLLRYRPFGPERGFFWSMDRELYAFLSDKTVIEGFASPFNRNSPNYCSFFEEDMRDFSSKGNVFEYMKKLDIPVRLILNPPYTEKIINRTADELISYVERVRGSECIVMIPNWIDCSGIIKMKEYLGSNWVVFDAYKY